MSIRSMLVAAVIVAAVVGIPLALAPPSSTPDGDEATAGESAAPASSEDTERPCDPARDEVCDPTGAASANDEAADEAPRPVPRFVDLGTTSCIPCKVMLGVMSELEERYPGNLRVEFIDVRANPDALKKHGFRAIPSQIFYAPDGRELFRHTGVMRVEAIVAKWAELGHPITPEGSGGR